MQALCHLVQRILCVSKATGRVIRCCIPRRRSVLAYSKPSDSWQPGHRVVICRVGNRQSRVRMSVTENEIDVVHVYNLGVAHLTCRVKAFSIKCQVRRLLDRYIHALLRIIDDLGDLRRLCGNVSLDHSRNFFDFRLPRRPLQAPHLHPSP